MPLRQKRCEQCGDFDAQLQTLRHCHTQGSTRRISRCAALPRTGHCPGFMFKGVGNAVYCQSTLGRYAVAWLPLSFAHACAGGRSTPKCRAGRRGAPTGAEGRRRAPQGAGVSAPTTTVSARQWYWRRSRSTQALNIIVKTRGYRLSPYAARHWYWRARVRYAALINMKGYEATIRVESSLSAPPRRSPLQPLRGGGAQA